MCKRASILLFVVIIKLITRKYISSAGGRVGSFVLGVSAATVGDYAKDRIKYNLKKDTDR